MASNKLKNGETRGTVTKKDITKLGLYSIIEQISFSFERMQAPGFTLSMLPAAKKIFKDSKEDMSEFMTYNMEFMNTEPHMATFLMGLIVSMEEHGEDRKVIEGLRNGLFGPFAGLGDAIFWFTLLPISAAISCSLAQDGSVLGPIIYIAIWMVAAFSRIWFASFGYKVGVKAVTSMTEKTKYITKAAGILGVMVVGGLIPAYIGVSFSDSLAFGMQHTTVQSVLDGILPNMLPLAVVFFIYWLFKKKNANVLIIILGIIAFSILMSLIGWM